MPAEFLKASQVLGIGGVGRRTGKGTSREGGSAHSPDGVDHRLLGMGRNRHDRGGIRHDRGGIRHDRGSLNHWPEPGEPVVKANQFLAPGDQSGVMLLPVPEPATDRVRDQCPGPLGLADALVEGLGRSGPGVDRVPELVGGHPPRVFRAEVGCRKGRGRPPARVIGPEGLSGNRCGLVVRRAERGHHDGSHRFRGDHHWNRRVRLSISHLGPAVFFLGRKAGKGSPDRSPAA